MTSLVVDPIAFMAVSRYSPASLGLTFLIVSDGLSILISDSFPPLSSVFSLSLFLVQNVSRTSGELSRKYTFPINITDWFLMFDSKVVVIFGGPIKKKFKKCFTLQVHKY